MNANSPKGPSVVSGGAEYRVIQVRTRWEAVQVGPNSFDVRIPVGNAPLLNPSWVEEARLSDREIEEAEYEVLRAVAVIR